MRITTRTNEKTETYTDQAKQIKGITKQKHSNKMQALLDSDFIGCGEGPEDLSANYKEYLYKELKGKL